MKLGDRIDERRKAIGISQAELARRAKVAQQTINGLINGDQRSSPHLPRIARILATTVNYLTGETDDPDDGALEPPRLLPDHEELIGLFDAMTPDDRETLMRTARAFAGVHLPSKQVLHTAKPAYRGERVAS